MAQLLQKFKETLNIKEFLYSGSVKGIEKDALWKPKDAIWVIFIGKSVTQGLPRDMLSGYLLLKEWKILEAKGATLNATYPASNKSVEATFGFNENQVLLKEDIYDGRKERMMHIKCKDENGLNLSESSVSFYHDFFVEFAEYLFKNNMLRSQTFDASKSNFSFQQLHEEMLNEKRKNLIERNSVFQQEQGVFVIFLNGTSREEVRTLLLDHCSDSGLTCKLEGKATVKGASSILSVTLRIGYNDKNERMLHCQNEVSFLGGDKHGALFKEFAKKLVEKAADKKMLREQKSLAFSKEEE